MTPATAFSSSPGVQRDQVYGRRPVREALRGRREVLEIWAGERALAAEPWLREAPLKVQVKPERELTEAVGTRDHQGVVAWTEPYRYADAWELAAAERPLIAALDQVTDPRNLGAVCRSAEGSGRDRRRRSRPRLGRRDAGRREGVRRRGRASARRGRPEPRALSRRDQASTTSGSTQPRAMPRHTLWETDFTGGTVVVLGAEGRGLRPLVRRTCDAAVSIPLAGDVESLNVSVAAALLLYEARRQRG